MAKQYDYDLVVIGAGPGGYVCAIRAAQHGARVACIERDQPGGVCLNVGCIPTKTLIASADVYEKVAHAEDFGIQVGKPEIDYQKVAGRKDKVVKTLRQGVLSLLKANDVEYIEGEASLAGAHALSVKDADGTSAQVTAGKIVIATGSKPAEIPSMPFDGERVISSNEAVGWSSLPDSLLIVGAGYIGCEFASLFATFGVKVHMVELLDRILPASDAECAQEIFKGLKKRKIKIDLGVKVEKVKKAGKGVEAQLSNGESLEADCALVCVGRRALTEGLNLDAADVQVDDRGVIKVNGYLQTSCPHIYAIGDVTGKLQLAHVASAQGIVVAEHATGQHPRKMRYEVVPSVVFAEPELASVGMSEEEARRHVEGELKIGKFQFRALGKAMASGETDGFVKVIADAATDEILGVHILAAHASDMLGEGAMALSLESTLKEVAETIHAHPTMPEAVMEAVEVALGQAIHVPPKRQ